MSRENPPEPVQSPVTQPSTSQSTQTDDPTPDPASHPTSDPSTPPLSGSDTTPVNPKTPTNTTEDEDPPPNSQPAPDLLSSRLGDELRISQDGVVPQIRFADPQELPGTLSVTYHFKLHEEKWRYE
jgi:hypothetical protein